MSVGPISSVTGALGSAYAQRAGEQDRAAQEAAGGERRAATEQHAELAAGIGQTEGEGNETADRDADGRRLFEALNASSKDADPSATGSAPRARDATGQLGNRVDILA